MSKIYRPRGKYQKVSLKLFPETLKKLEKAVNDTNHKNMSQLIEEIVSIKNIKKYNNRRKSGFNLIKKSFTFSSYFYQKIKKTGNMSLFVDLILQKNFKIK